MTERLKAKIRKEDTLFRLGGDEFTIIMEDLKNIQDVSLLANKILEVLTQPIHIEGHTLYISCSIGISFYPQDDTDANNLLKYADVAIVKAIIALAKSLRLDFMVEGVETDAQKEFLLDSVCDNIQGYYYCEPMPAEEIEEKCLGDL